MARIWQFVGKFGSAGSGDGQFNTIRRVCVDDYIYVADSGNNRIQIFNKSTFAFVNKFGSLGSGNGQFNNPMDIAVDSNYIYVLDRGNGRIQIFNKSSLAYIDKFGVPTGQGGPYCFCVDANVIYVSADNGSFVGIFKYNKTTFVYLGGYNKFAAYYGVAVNTENIYCCVLPTSLYIFRLSDFTQIGGVNVGPPNDVDIDSNYIYVFTSSGQVLLHNIATHAFVELFGSLGTGDGQFQTTGSISVKDNYVYVADAGNNRIQKFELVIGEAPSAPSSLTTNHIGGRSVQLNWVDNS